MTIHSFFNYRIKTFMKYINPFILLAILVAACSAPAAEQAEEESTSEAITLSAEQLAYNQIETGKLTKGPVYHTVKATGMVDVPPNFSLKLSAPIEAYVTKIKVLPGDKVNKGQVLAQLTHPAIAQLQKDFLGMQAQLKFVTEDLERKEQLLDGKAVAQRTYDQLKSDQVSLQAQLRSLEQEMSRLGMDSKNLQASSVSQVLELRAPIAGVVTDVFIKTGEHVSTVDPIVSILNREHEHVELQIFQGDLAKVKKSMLVNMRLPGGETIYTGEVFLVNTQLNTESLSANVHVHPGEDFPHLPVNAVVFGEVVYQVDSVYTLPKSEVIREGNAYFIFIKTNEGFVKTLIDVGYTDEQNVEITGPAEVLKQEVVVKGNYNLNGV